MRGAGAAFEHMQISPNVSDLGILQTSMIDQGDTNRGPQQCKHSQNTKPFIAKNYQFIGNTGNNFTASAKSKAYSCIIGDGGIGLSSRMNVCSIRSFIR